MLKKFLSALLIAVAVFVFGYCAYNIYSTLQERALSNKEYVDTREKYVSAITEDGGEEPQKKQETGSSLQNLNVDHEGLSKINSDYIGWLYYADADISYPIVQAQEDNPDYYLTHTFEGYERASGCIFIDYDIDPLFTARNTFIYGHNMYNGTMFGGLKKLYNDPSTIKDPYFYIYLKNGSIQKYRVFAIYIVDENDKTAFSIPGTTDGELTYISRALKRGSIGSYSAFSKKENDILEEGENQIATFSTCYGRSGTTMRLLTQGILVDEF